MHRTTFKRLRVPTGAPRAIGFAMALGVAVSSTTAFANVEPVAYDTRSVALGGTGVSFVQGPSAIAQNPASLEGVERFSFLLSASPVLFTQQAPLQGPGSETESGLGFAPLGALYLAGRIAPRVVFGFGVYTEVAFGSRYSGVVNVDGANPMDNDEPGEGKSQDVTAAIVETSFGVSFRILPTLSIGASVRFPFMLLDADLYQNAGTLIGVESLYTQVNANVRGMGFPTPRVGLHWQPIPELSLGVQYRMYSRIPLSGELEAVDNALLPDPLPATTSFNHPNAIQFGLATHLLGDRLMLVLEERVQFSGAKRTGNDNLNITAVTPDILAPVLGDSVVLGIPLQWKNVWSTRFGIEGAVSSLIDLRGGATFQNSAVPKEFAFFAIPPAGRQWGAHLGIGFHWKRVDLDIAGGAMWSVDTVDSSVSRNADGTPREVTLSDGSTIALCSSNQLIRSGCAGDYKAITYWSSIGFTYRMKPRN